MQVPLNTIETHHPPLLAGNLGDAWLDLRFAKVMTRLLFKKKKKSQYLFDF